MTSKEIVDVIEAELIRQNKTKGEFFAACNVTRAQMSNWRREKNFPQTPVLITISNYLGINLLGTKEPATNNGNGQNATSNPKREEINRLLPLAPEWLQNQILALLKAEESGRTSQGVDPKDR